MAGNFFNRTKNGFSNREAQSSETPNGARASSSHSHANNNNDSSFNFSDFELPNINFGSFLSQSFCQKKFPSNFSDIFQSKTYQSGNVVCENCGTKLSFLKRKVMSVNCCYSKLGLIYLSLSLSTCIGHLIER